MILYYFFLGRPDKNKDVVNDYSKERVNISN